MDINKGDNVVVDVAGDKLVLRALKPKAVDIYPEIIENMLCEEHSLEGRDMRG